MLDEELSLSSTGLRKEESKILMLQKGIMCWLDHWTRNGQAQIPTLNHEAGLGTLGQSLIKIEKVSL